MEAPDDVKQALNRNLDITLKKISAYVAHSNSRKDTYGIQDLEEFVFGMVYQSFFKKCVDYNVKYVQALDSQTKRKNAIDMSSVSEAIFESRTGEIRQIINAYLEKARSS